ncbi:MAG: peptidase M61 [Bacteroidia bacterium]|nr:peptidase M61 [Bacteroidia bacterium]
MRTRILFLFCALWAPLFSQTVLSPAPPVFRYMVDLANVINDRLEVKVKVPDLGRKELKFFMPEIIPGTYSIYNFGRFVSGFKALSADGKELPVTRADTNTWIIKDAEKLSLISYWVEDTWDTEQKHNPIFEPAGTAIDAGKFYLLNHGAFFGYFEGYKFNPYKIIVNRPASLYGATGIHAITSSQQADTFHLKNYDELIDSPIFYAPPDTISILVGNARVLIAVRAPGQKITAKEIAGELKPLLMAQKEYLGGKLPVNKYAFLFCFASETEGLSGASGALEHSYSSVYFLPEMRLTEIKQMLRDVTAHEFFHIITPLTIHSEEIGDFSFNAPRMSRHLWLYEGCTEYAASHVQVRGGLISTDEFLETIRNKMVGAMSYNDTLPFTVMSLEVLTKYEKEYANVYQKGALIGMCLDILLLHHSDGKYSLRDLLRDLGQQYGADRSFKDNELFDLIVSKSFPEIGVFLKKYVAGNKPLPFTEVLALAGIDYRDEVTVESFSYGGMSIGYNPQSGKLVVMGTSGMDDFGKELGFREGDELISFNKSELTLNNVKAVLEDYMTNAKEGKKLKVVVSREVDGRNKKVKLKATIRKVRITEKHILFPMRDMSPKRERIRKAWLGGVK